MYLQRPGRMRFEFDPPAELLLLSDGFWFIYVDLEIDGATHIPLGQTPASFLLDEEVALDGEDMVVALSQASGLTVAEIIKREEPGLGSLQLVFSDSPFGLRQWTVTDAQGLQTQVTFTEAQFDLELDRALFRYVKQDSGRN